MDDEQARAARRKQALLDSALVLLLARAGGELRFTEAEYQEAVARFGGSARANMHFEVVREQGKADTVVLRLENKPPRNAELPT